MIESVHCPQCQTRYGLRPARVRYGMRRAKCLRCGGTFPIEDEVTRLLAAGLPQESVQPSAYFQTFGVPASTLAAAQSEPDEAPVVEEMPNSLTLQDLEDPEEILDKTLVDYRTQPPVPELIPEPVSAPTPEAHVTGDLDAPPPEAITTGGGGFSSARDAIDKILGNLGSPAPKAEAHAKNPMDVEATLDALDKTLGGQTTFPPPPPDLDFLPDPEPLPEHALGTAHMELLPEPQAAPATVRLTREEMLAAMSAPVEAPNAQLDPPPAMPLMPPPPTAQSALPPMEDTLVMNVPPMPPPPPPPSAPTAFMPVAESQEQNLFKAQVGTDTLSNLSMTDLSEMVVQGRLGDFHMVARQFSENWIEAGKVPALRPLFERLKREAAQTGDAPAAEAPQKRSLFGGLFGRKDG